MGKIIDQFTDLKMSRQRKWQARHRAAGLCIECGDVLVSKSYCKYHHLKLYLKTRARVKPKTVLRTSIGAQLWVEALRAQKIHERKPPIQTPRATAPGHTNHANP